MMNSDQNQLRLEQVITMFGDQGLYKNCMK